MSKRLFSRSAEETKGLGVTLGRLLWGGELICLEGELGAGKTTLIQGIGQGLGIEEPMVSPTFTMMREYHGPRGIFYHVDLYRIQSEEEIIAAGLDEPFWGEGICAVEWAERAKGLLPQENLWITLKHVSGDRRMIHLEARGGIYQALLSRLAKELKWRPS